MDAQQLNSSADKKKYMLVDNVHRLQVVSLVENNHCIFPCNFKGCSYRCVYQIIVG